MTITHLRPFQQRTKDKLLSGASYILQAPTGAGKTHAALAPFFDAWQNGNAYFPRKCFYVVPRRVLATQFYDDYRAHAENLKMRVRIQTGEQPNDQKLGADLIFCTIDQFLSSFLTMPYGLPRKLANVNAGALVGAYIVMDEFHLHDPSPTLPTALYALKLLQRIAPVLLMTATFSEDMLARLAHWLNCDYERVPHFEIHHIETTLANGTNCTPRQRIWYASEAALSVEAVLSRHQTRSIVICNTVARAQRIFCELSAEIAQRKLDIECKLLHSRFLQEDRRKIEQWAISEFGENARPFTNSKILVATQVVEVGLNVTCESLHTETAPASALIQRAGRCARFKSEQGNIFVYPLSGSDLLPYKKEKGAEAVAAHEWLTVNTDRVLDFDGEQELINAVSAQNDRQVIAALTATEDQHQETIFKTLKGDLAWASQTLVRDADSRKLVIHQNPDVLLGAPFDAEGFNVAPTTLVFTAFDAWSAKANAAGTPIGHWVKRLAEVPDADADETRYQWAPIDKKDELWGASIACVHPALAGYSKTLGLLLTESVQPEWESSIRQKPRQQQAESYGRGYKLESYTDHIRLVLEAMRDPRVEGGLVDLSRQMTLLERAAGWPAGTLNNAAEIAGLLHDVGKLSDRWQSWVECYQTAIGKPVPVGFAGAHTDFEKGNVLHEAQSKATGSMRGTHAAESAVACMSLIEHALEALPEKSLDALTRAILTAIARHHTAFVADCSKFTLIPQAAKEIAGTLKFVQSHLAHELLDGLNVGELEMKNTAQLALQNAYLARPEYVYEWFAYVMLARILRIADGEGTGHGGLR